MLVCCAAGAACSLGGSSAGTVVIYVHAPFASSPWVGRTGQQGAQLAADEINSRNGVTVAGRSYHIKIRTADHKGSPDQALANIRKAAAEKAVAALRRSVRAAAGHDDRDRRARPPCCAADCHIMLRNCPM